MLQLNVILWVPQVERSRAKSGIKPEEGDKELAPVLDNSIAWGGFVATSTNVRYQLVNGFEERGLVCHFHSVLCMSKSSMYC